MPHRCGDPFQVLPDAVIQHLLGFLPAHDAVRTSVLARRWHTLWRSVPRLRVVEVEALGSVWKLNTFMSRVLAHRGPSSALDECEFDLRGFPHLLNYACVDQWMRHTSLCHIRVLQVRLFADGLVALADWPLLSRHLMRLELEGLYLRKSFLDFSGCPVLEDLKITNCTTETDNILCGSLKRLSITGCALCWQYMPTHISAPNISSLQLEDYDCVTPVLESMPLLETAYVKLGHINEEYCDFCDKGVSEHCTCDMRLLYYDDDQHRNNVTVLLGGLSSVTHLELKASPLMVTFQRDLRCCPTFSKLKTLLLDDCCLANLFTLICFLQHTPNLEKLILQLSMSPKPALQMDSSNKMYQSLLLNQLKTVKVKCQITDERVQNILKILCSCSIDIKKIDVLDTTNL